MADLLTAPARLDGDAFWYTFHQLDGSIREAAAFYGSSAEDVWRANQSASEYVDATSLDDFIARVVEGSTLLIPTPLAERELHWGRVAAKGRYPSLRALCNDVNNDDHWYGQKPVTPYEVLRYAANAELRARLEIDYAWFFKLNAADVDLPADAVVALPFAPMPPRRVAAAPQTRDAPVDLTLSSTARLAPPWIVTLYDRYLNALDDLTRELELANEACEKIRYQAVSEVGGLDLLRHLLEELDCPREKTEKLRDALASFRAVAIDKLGGDPAGYLKRPEAERRADRAERVTALLESEEFATLAERAFVEDHDVIVRYAFGFLDLKPRRLNLKELIADVVQRALLAVLLSGPTTTSGSTPQAKVLRRCDAALDGIGTASLTSLPGGTVIEKIVSVMGAHANVTARLLGALPGPRLLALHVIAAAVAPRMVATGVTSTGPGDVERVVRAMVAASGLRGDEARAFEAAFRARIPDAVTLWNKGIYPALWRGVSSVAVNLKVVTEGLPQTQVLSFDHMTRVTAGIKTVFSIVGLFVALSGSDAEASNAFQDVRLIAAAGTATSELAGGLLRVGLGISPVRAFDKSVIKGVSGFGGLMALVSGGATLVEGIAKGDGMKFLTGSLTFVRGGLGVAAAFSSQLCIPIWGEVIGWALVALAVIDMFTGDSSLKRLFMGILTSIVRGGEQCSIEVDARFDLTSVRNLLTVAPGLVVRLDTSSPTAVLQCTPNTWLQQLMRDPDLDEAYKRFVAECDASDPFSSHLRYSDENRELLRTLGIAEPDFRTFLALSPREKAERAERAMSNSRWK